MRKFSVDPELGRIGISRRNGNIGLVDHPEDVAGAFLPKKPIEILGPLAVNTRNEPENRPVFL